MLKIEVVVFFSVVYVVFGVPKCNVTKSSALSWSADCSSMDLTRLPEHLLEHPIVNVSLSHNQLRNVTFRNWTSLQYLNIAFNDIEKIDQQMFFSLTKLKFLNISYNMLSLIEPGDLKELENLKVLDISGNFALKTQEELLMAFLNETLFNGINELYIRSLGVQYFPDDFFKHSYELTLLDLRNNNLKILPQFPGSLIHLDISENQFSDMTLHSFYRAHRLDTIIAERNKNLRTISHDAFHYLRNLKKLSFRESSQLDYLPPALFYHTPLKHLSIAYCNFKTLEPYLKHYFLNLDFLDLRGNLWVCDSKLKWIKTLKPEFHKDVRCASPRDILLSDHFGTKLSHTVLKNLLGVLVGLVLIFFFLAIWFAFEMERKRRADQPYSPLGKNNVTKQIYLSTVV